ncbi:MAG: bacteriohemerythrin [Humidesulfovibrio sp.]|uniref:bacteriohemerythrin n=1 Tax=Humidesulfovibrio sp. TaxID=2910988 RepID=UPI0027EE5017|nr:bacteriohemerythrin [Humidesulfovibrio sp.]MDQ7836228.1 bacteriohemerythrin [Humidesulfovibrio sp.]
MPLFEWDGSLALGHELIDAQHKSLVELVDQLHGACLDGAEGSDPRSVLMALYKYTMFHFSEEERLMKQANYAEYAEHKAEHDTFVSKLDALAVQAKQGRADIGQETLKWLVAWLLNHISVVDKRLAACLPKG